MLRKIKTLGTIMGIMVSLIAFAIDALSQDLSKHGPRMEIRGVVVDFSGRPWKGAGMYLKSKELVFSKSETQSKIALETLSAADGSYAFRDLPIGTYEVTLGSADGVLREAKDVPILMDGGLFIVDFGLEIGAMGDCPRYTVIGYVKDKRNKALVGATVSVINAFNHRRVLSVKTARNGIYRLGLCSAGQYIVFVNTPNYEVRANMIRFSTGDLTKTVDFIITPLQKY